MIDNNTLLNAVDASREDTDLVTPDQKRHASAYVRASTTDQINTLQAQKNEMKNYCEFKGLILDEESIFSEQISAVKYGFLNRPQAIAMMEHCRSNGIRTIIIHRLDRAFRNTIDGLKTISQIHDEGFDVHILDLGIDTRTPVGELIFTIMAAVSRFEGRLRKLRQSNAIDVMKDNDAVIGTVPYGFDDVPDTSKPEVKPGTPRRKLVWNLKEKSVILEIFALDDLNFGFGEIASHLNNKEIPTKTGKKWQFSTVQSIVNRREFYEEKM